MAGPTSPYHDDYGDYRGSSPGDYRDSPPNRTLEAYGLTAGRLWATGAATAAVAALAAVVATLLIRGVLGVAVFAPHAAGALGDATTGWLATGAALCALAATGLLHLLIVGTTQPRRFLLWIVSLVTAAMMILPFTYGLRLSEQLGTAAVYLVVGVTIGSLLPAALSSPR